MLSLYLHIPFCQYKCKYCSFATYPFEEMNAQVDRYLQALHQEIAEYGKFFPQRQIKTLYLWGGTPNLIWAERLIALISQVEKYFDLTYLEELSFEFNPYPAEEVYQIVKKIQKVYGKKYPRVRFSFGIQSFDNEVLQQSGRGSLFLGLVDFLRGLQQLKQDSTVFNFDFIAFGKWNQSKKGNPYLWNPSALQFFENLVQSQFADSFSLYTLELFDKQAWKKRDPNVLISGAYFGTDEQVYEEFDILKNIILDGGYRRYELSNFSLAGKSSIHNRVYREMQDYLGLGISAASFLTNNSKNADFVSQHLSEDAVKGLRFKNTSNFEAYCERRFLDPHAFEQMSSKDWLIEEFFLSLRTAQGIRDFSRFESILVADFAEKIASYQEQGFVEKDQDQLWLSDAGMDVFNTIVTSLLQEI